MHEHLVCQAVIPRPIRILGLDMMNYSLGCELQLHREKSPFLAARSEFDDLAREKKCFSLIRAVQICCKRVHRWNWLWHWRHFPHSDAELALAVVDFRNYLEDGRLQYQANLPASTESGGHRYLGEPELMRLYRFVCEHVPRAEIELYGSSAWDFPFSFAKLWSQGHAEGEGGLEIYNIQKKTHDDYHRQCEQARSAWVLAKTDAEKHAALDAFPLIRELLDLKEQVETFSPSPQPETVPQT
jgi:hypothetical protein